MARLCCDDEIGCRGRGRVSEEPATRQQQGSGAVWSGREAANIPQDNLASRPRHSTQLKSFGCWRRAVACAALNKTLKQEKAMRVLSLVGLFALFLSPLQAQEQKDVAVTQLLSTTRTSSGQPIGLPQKDAQIVASVYNVMPGATLPVHNHPHLVTDMSLAGILRVTNVDISTS